MIRQKCQFGSNQQGWNTVEHSSMDRQLRQQERTAVSNDTIGDNRKEHGPITLDPQCMDMLQQK